MDMKVSGPNRSNAINAYNKNSSNKITNEKKEIKGVKVSLSKEAIAFKDAMKTARERAVNSKERIDELKEKIQSGNYSIDSSKIADSIIKKSIIHDK